MKNKKNKTSSKKIEKKIIEKPTAEPKIKFCAKHIEILTTVKALKLFLKRFENDKDSTFINVIVGQMEPHEDDYGLEVYSLYENSRASTDEDDGECECGCNHIVEDDDEVSNYIN